MKIGILTFHCAHNFGAVLQCYALYNILNSMGHNTYIINYRPQYLISPYKPLSLYWFTPPIYFKQIIKNYYTFTILSKEPKNSIHLSINSKQII